MRRKRKNTIVISLLLLCVIGVGFAYLSTNLTINGTAKIKATTWDVHFDNVHLTSGSATTASPTIGTDNVSASFETTLNEPGDFYEFIIDVVNEGSIDAMISDFDLGSLTTDQAKYLDYSVTYSDGVAISKKDLLSAGSTETLKVRIEFKSDVNSSDLPTSGDTITKNISITYVQNDGGKAVDHSNMELDDTNSNGVADTGEIITIGTEYFYVISNDGTNVKALAEWNLLVGNQYDGSSTTATALTNPTGLQDSSAIGWHYASGTTTYEYPWIGTVAFSSSSYWTGTDGETIDITNSANTINPYLTAYKTSLTNLGGKISDVSLITKAELISLGCDASSNSCTGAPSWVYQTSYWSRSAYITTRVWYVSSHGNFYYSNFTSGSDIGVRPVITILASDIK